MIDASRDWRRPHRTEQLRASRAECACRARAQASSRSPRTGSRTPRVTVRSLAPGYPPPHARAFGRGTCSAACACIHKGNGPLPGYTRRTHSWLPRGSPEALHTGFVDVAWDHLRSTAPHEPRAPAGAASRACLAGSPHLDRGALCVLSAYSRGTPGVLQGYSRGTPGVLSFDSIPHHTTLRHPHPTHTVTHTHHTHYDTLHHHTHTTHFHTITAPLYL